MRSERLHRNADIDFILKQPCQEFYSTVIPVFDQPGDIVVAGMGRVGQMVTRLLVTNGYDVTIGTSERGSNVDDFTMPEFR